MTDPVSWPMVKRSLIAISRSYDQALTEAGRVAPDLICANRIL
jgi:hypothetical protein